MVRYRVRGWLDARRFNTRSAGMPSVGVGRVQLSQTLFGAHPATAPRL
jgi:hypothetical protein